MVGVGQGLSNCLNQIENLNGNEITDLLCLLQMSCFEPLYSIFRDITLVWYVSVCMLSTCRGYSRSLNSQTALTIGCLQTEQVFNALVYLLWFILSLVYLSLLFLSLFFFKLFLSFHPYICKRYTINNTISVADIWDYWSAIQTYLMKNATQKYLYHKLMGFVSLFVILWLKMSFIGKKKAN